MANKKQTDKKETFRKEIKLKDLSSKSLTELLELKSAIEYLIDYYDNYARANTGIYPYETEEFYKMAKDLCDKYYEGLMSVFREIENKVNDEVFA